MKKLDASAQPHFVKQAAAQIYLPKTLVDCCMVLII